MFKHILKQNIKYNEKFKSILDYIDLKIVPRMYKISEKEELKKENKVLKDIEKLDL